MDNMVGRNKMVEQCQFKSSMDPCSSTTFLQLLGQHWNVSSCYFVLGVGGVAGEKSGWDGIVLGRNIVGKKGWDQCKVLMSDNSLVSFLAAILHSYADSPTTQIGLAATCCQN